MLTIVSDFEVKAEFNNLNHATFVFTINPGAIE
jgi:hypothetical protein